MEILLWLFLNVIVALAPIGVICAAIRFHGEPVTVGKLLGDGFLFFYTVVLATGLIGDVAKAAERNGACRPGAAEIANGCMSTHFLILVVIGGVCVIGCTMLAYGFALIRRFSEAPGDGKRFAKASIWFAVVATALTLFVRFSAKMW